MCCCNENGFSFSGAVAMVKNFRSIFEAVGEVEQVQ